MTSEPPAAAAAEVATTPLAKSGGGKHGGRQQQQQREVFVMAGMSAEKQQSVDPESMEASQEEEASAGPQDSDFAPSSSADEEGEEEEEGRGKDSDPEFRLSDESDEWEDRPRRRRPAPAEGTRRSKRLRDAGVAPAEEWGPEEEEEEEPVVERRAPRPMRGAAIRSGLAIVPPGTEPGSLGPSAVPSKAGSPLPNGAAAAGDQSEAAAAVVAPPKPEGIMSPMGQLVQRIKTPEEVEEEKREIQGLWELAAVLDFLQLFRPQLKISRNFGPDELEHCLVTSLGDSGLLADLHSDIMKGISPKSDVCPANWQIHLANKIKYHWKPLLDGADCPFKPDKYFERVNYAVLPSRDRVRALHFILCVRADREDIAARLLAAQAEGPMLGQAAAGTVPETLANFRRQPHGYDSQGRGYYYMGLGDGGQGFRLFRHTPAPYILPEGPGEGSAEAIAEAIEREAYAVAAGSKTTQEPTWLQQERVAMRLPPQQAAGGWELVAASMEELRALGEGFASSADEREQALGAVIHQTLLPGLLALQEEEEKRLRAAERVQKKLGSAVPEAATNSGKAGMDEFGRPRRERRQVNYAFNDYDDMLKSAIRRSQRGEESEGESEEGRRRKRKSPMERFDAVTEAHMGMRRGRSAAAIKDAVNMSDFVDERALRQQQQQQQVSRAGSRAGSRRGSRSASAVDLQQQAEVPPAASGEDADMADAEPAGPQGYAASAEPSAGAASGAVSANEDALKQESG